MSTTTTYTELTPELMEQVRKLSPEDYERLFIETQPETDHVREPLSPEWKAEIKRRIELIESGQMKMYTIEETMAHLAERRKRRA